MKNLVFLICLYLSSGQTFGQNRYLNIGYGNCGIAFGNSSDFNGLRINALDKNVIRINGVNVSLAGVNPFFGYPRTASTNGLTIGACLIEDAKSNGVSIAGLGIRIDTINGASMTSLFLGGQKINGLAVAGLAVYGKELRGVFVAGVGIGFWPRGVINKIEKIQGVSLAFGGVSSIVLNGLSVVVLKNGIDTLNGICFGLYNDVKELYGVQIGLWNHAGNNRLINFPFVNFNFRRKPRS